MSRLRLLPPAILCLAAVTARGADLPPADRPVERVIDDLVGAKIAAEGVVPAPMADDATLVRRLTLDLVGRIPTLGEVEAYVGSAEPGKRVRLVDRLMASPGYARHQAAQFEAMLSDKPGSGSLRDYLTAAVAENRPWDRVFRELVLPDRADPKPAGAADFLRPRLKDPDRLTNDVSVLFFGVNVSCAQCHDHPLVPDWKQDHFYGMKAFFARTYDAAGQIAERAAGVVRFKPNKGPEKTAKMMFLTGAVVTDPGDRDPTAAEAKQEREDAARAKQEKKAPPPPANSARARFVDVALRPAESEFFARAIVNRVWHRFFGLGLVTPLDQMHSENPPSHPELLAWLARDVKAHGYDLRRLVRGIVLSEAYARDSRYPSEAVPDPRLFAVARLKPLTPLQLSASLKIAGTDPRAFDGLKPAEFEKRVEGLENSARGFAALIAQPTDNFQIGVGEALLFSNGDRVVKEFLGDGGGSLLARARAEKDAAGAVALMTRVVLGRAATAEESAALTAYIRARADRPADAHRQVLWALVTCPEFRFNH